MSGIKLSEESNKAAFLKVFFNRALREIMLAVRADCGSLFLSDSKNEELILNSFYNSYNIDILGQKQRIGEGISGKVANSKHPVLVKDIDLDSRFHRNGFTHYRTKSFISIPLFIQDKLIGLMNVADKSNKEQFAETDLDCAVLIAKYACLTLENMRNYYGLQEEKDDLYRQKACLEKYASVGKLAAGVVHEVNNPLDGILRYTNMILGQMDNNSVAREYLLEIKNGLSRIADTTKSLLEFSYQINSSPIQANSYVGLHQLLDECLFFRQDKACQEVKVERCYLADSSLQVADMGILHVFRNLIKNAYDAMPEGGKLEVSTGMDNEALKVSFKDTGAGIPEDVKQSIFEPFFTTKPIHKGNGLGLAISKEIINKYCGKIEVESKVGKGTAFTVFIPIRYTKNG